MRQDRASMRQRIADGNVITGCSCGSSRLRLCCRKRADDKSASAKTTKKNAPERKVGLTAHVLGVELFPEARDERMRRLPETKPHTGRQTSTEYQRIVKYNAKHPTENTGRLPK